MRPKNTSPQNSAEALHCYTTYQNHRLEIVASNEHFAKDFGRNKQTCFAIFKGRNSPCESCPAKKQAPQGEILQSIDQSALPGTPFIICNSTSSNSSTEHTRWVVSTLALTTKKNDPTNTLLKNQLISQELLVGSITHGLKGYINGVDGGLYLMNSGFKRNLQTRIDQGLDMVRRNVDRLRNTVSCALYYLKKRDFAQEPIEVKMLLSEVSRLFQRRADQLKVELDISPESTEAPKSFEGDHHGIFSILVNLIDFSLAACFANKKEPHKKVSLRVEDRGDLIQFVIENNGLELDQEALRTNYSLHLGTQPGKTDYELYLADKLATSVDGRFFPQVLSSGDNRFTVALPKK